MSCRWATPRPARACFQSFAVRISSLRAFAHSSMLRQGHVYYTRSGCNSCTMELGCSALLNFARTSLQQPSAHASNGHHKTGYLVEHAILTALKERVITLQWLLLLSVQCALLNVF